MLKNRIPYISPEAWKFLWKYFSGQQKRLVITSAGSIIHALTLIPTLLLVKYVFDSVIPQKQIPGILWAGAAIVLIRLGSSALILWVKGISIRIVTEVVFNIRTAVTQKVFSFSRSFYTREDQRLLQTRIVNDTERIGNMCNTLLSGVIPAVLISLGLIIILFIFNWFLFLIIAILFLLIIFSGHYFGKVTKSRVHAFQRAFERFSTLTFFVMKFMELIKIQSMENQERQKQSETLADLREKSGRMSYAFTVSGQVQTFLVGTAGILVMVIGGISVVKGTMSLGVFFAFYIAATQLQNNINTINSAITAMVTGNESLVTLYEIAVHTDTEPYHGAVKSGFSHQIELENIFFSYDKEPVLKNLSLKIIHGKSIAIIGPNGAGKSTLINLLLGFHAPLKGTIIVDRMPYTDLDFNCFRRSFGVVSQYPSLIPGTIRRNICYGNEAGNDDEIHRVNQLSMASGFIGKLPEGLETQIGEDGLLLSGGERQMVAISRALLRQPGLLILDEPTNHLDNKIVGQIMQNLKTINPQPAILIISHNMEVVSHAEEIFILDQGQLKRYEV